MSINISDSAQINGTVVPESSQSATVGLSNHIILCGLAHLGYRIMEQLLDANFAVLVIDENPEARFTDALSGRAVTLLRRDSRAKETLEEARVREARAIIILYDDDLRNLETLLKAKQLNPGLRTVVRFFNEQISDNITDKARNIVALSSSELASPAFVRSCFADKILHEFEIGRDRVAVVVDSPTQAGTVGELYQGLFPIRVEDLPPPGAPEPAGPTRVIKNIVPKTPIQPEDRVYLIGRQENLLKATQLGLNEDDFEHDYNPYRRRPKTPGRVLKTWQLLRQFFFDVDVNFRVVLFISLIVTLIGTLVFIVGHNPDPISALYTIVSVFMGENSLENDSGWVKLVGIGFTIIGTGLLGVIYAYVTDYIVTARISQALGKQKATEMENHIVLVGLGRVGYNILRQLVKRQERVVVIEMKQDSPALSYARSKQVPVLVADARLPETLEKLANLQKARCVVVTTDDDLGNIEMGLRARSINKNVRVVLRLFNAELADELENQFGIRRAFSVSAIAAPYFIANALNYEVLTTFYANRVPYMVSYLTIKTGGLLDGLNGEEFFRKTGVMVFAYYPKDVVIQQAGNVPNAEQLVVRQLTPKFCPEPASLHLSGGDIIYIVGPCERIASVYNKNA